MSKEIFISYRRKDTGSAAGRLYDALKESIGKRSVFKDIDNIGPGVDFRKAIGRELLNAKVVLILIGDRYTTLKNESGQARIKTEADFVREEAAIALAFRDKKLVIPIFVDGASVPKKENLPEDLHDLTFLNGMPLSHDRWKDDVENITEQVQHYLNPRKPPIRRDIPDKKTSNNGTIIFLTLVILGLITLGVWLGPKLMEHADGPIYVNPSDLTELDFTGVVTSTQLNLRDAIGAANSNVLTVLNNGEHVNVQGSKLDEEEKVWYLVETNGVKGWVSSNFITLDKTNYVPPVKPDPRPKTNAELIKGKWLFNEFYYNGYIGTRADLGTLYDFQDGVVYLTLYGQNAGELTYFIAEDQITVDGITYQYDLLDDVLEVYVFQYDAYNNLIPTSMILVRQ